MSQDLEFIEVEEPTDFPTNLRVDIIYEGEWHEYAIEGIETQDLLPNEEIKIRRDGSFKIMSDSGLEKEHYESIVFYNGAIEGAFGFTHEKLSDSINVDKTKFSEILSAFCETYDNDISEHVRRNYLNDDERFYQIMDKRKAFEEKV